ncbi:MAG: formate dehydrogenase accessory sulfurtransferase FdhD [Clostridia bacterium]|nr:formate dehydrogenase accessory sulfurtransferase FdhD [Clostridia bacterium]
MPITKPYRILRLQGETHTDVEDTVMCEYRLPVYVNGRHFITLLCMEQDLDALALGHLCSSGVIHSTEDVQSLVVVEGVAHITLRDDAFLADDEATRPVRTLTTTLDRQHPVAYAVCGDPAARINADVRFKLADVQKRVQSFQGDSELFIATGGVHSCALCGADGRLLYFMEDLGRHNAFDKAIGAALRDGVALSACFMMTSGRIPSDMLIKAVNARLPMIVSRSAPTDAAIDMAREYGVTLCGFARGARMNIYSVPERLI